MSFDLLNELVVYLSKTYPDLLSLNDELYSCHKQNVVSLAPIKVSKLPAKKLRPKGRHDYAIFHVMHCDFMNCDSALEDTLLRYVWTVYLCYFHDRYSD